MRVNPLPKILLIANRPQTLSAIRGLVDCYLTVAWTTQSALDASANTRFDLVVIDSRLPRVDAQLLVNKLRALAKNQAVPALVLTKSGVDEITKMALAAMLPSTSPISRQDTPPMPAGMAEPGAATTAKMTDKPWRSTGHAFGLT